MKSSVKIISFIFFVVTIYACSNKRIVKQGDCLFIEQGDGIGTLSFKKKTFAQIRELALKQKMFNYNKVNDTLFTLDYYHLESASFYSTLWSKTDTLNYLYRENKFNFSDHKEFSYGNIYELVSNWDTTQMNSRNHRINSFASIYAQRIIFNNGKCQMQSFLLDW